MRHVHAARREHCKQRFPDTCDQIDSLVLGRFCRSLLFDGHAAAKRSALAPEWLLSRKRCGDATVEEMRIILEKATFLRTGICCTHDRECDMYSGVASVLAVGGNRCLNWSIMGEQEER